MAFEKKPLQDGVKTKLKDYSVDLENRIDSSIIESLTGETAVHNLGHNDVSINDHLIAFSRGISINGIYENSGFPANYGVLVTFRAGGGVHYGVQLFFGITGGRITRKRTYAQGTWSAWGSFD